MEHVDLWCDIGLRRARRGDADELQPYLHLRRAGDLARGFSLVAEIRICGLLEP